MAHYEVTIASPLSQQEAFERLAAVERFQEWDPGVSAGKQIEGDRPGVGASFELEVKGFVGNSLPLVYKTTSFDEPFRFVIVAESKALRSDDVITVVEAGSGCEVTYAADLVLLGLFAIGNPLLGLAFDRIGDRAAAGLRTFLEAD